MYVPRLIKHAVMVAETLQQMILEKTGEPNLLNKFPREMATLITYGFEIPIVRVPNLTLYDASHYLCALCDNSDLLKPETDRRPLFGLLHVGPPSTLILIKDNLPEIVGNYVLAHELAHYIADILLVQQLWTRTLPEQKQTIEKAFTWQGFDAHLELQTILKNLPSRPATITGRGKALASETTNREILADLIARELLAPWNTVTALYRRNDRHNLPLLLREKFNLPKRIATYYAYDLDRYLNHPTDTVDRLFAPLLKPKR